MLLKEKIVSDFRDITALGSYSLLIPLIIFVFLAGIKTLALQLLIGFVLTYAIAFIIRIFYFKDRPAKEKYNSMLSKIDSSSFPSVHSARAILYAVLISNYFNNYILYIFLVVLALIVSYSRVYLKKHYWIDVVAGWIIGLVLVFPILRFF